LKIVKNNKLLFLVMAIYMILFSTMPEKALLSGKNSMYYVIEMLQIMPVVLILTSLIETWVPRNVIINSFGEKSGVKGSFYSFLLGSISAGPIYAAFPVCKMLLRRGASVANVVIILSAWAVVKVPMLANEAKFLGPRFMGIRWFLTSVSIFLMAYITSAMVKKARIPIDSDSEVNIGVNEAYCMGCGVCVKLCPEHFSMEDGKAKFAKNDVSMTSRENFKKAMDKCPAKAIHMPE